MDALRGVDVCWSVDHVLDPVLGMQAAGLLNGLRDGRGPKSRHYMFGLHFVISTLEGSTFGKRKPKVVFVAYDVEASYAWKANRAVRAIMDLARQAGVPVIFPLSRAQLAEAVGLVGHLSTVAVMDVGPHDDLFFDLMDRAVGLARAFQATPGGARTCNALMAPLLA